jgi:hypothetical protein
MRKLFALLVSVMLIAPATAMAIDDAKTMEDLRKRIEELSSQLEGGFHNLFFCLSAAGTGDHKRLSFVSSPVFYQGIIKIDYHII